MKYSNRENCSQKQSKMKEDTETKNRTNKILTKKIQYITHISFAFFRVQLILFYNYPKQRFSCCHTYIEKMPARRPAQAEKCSVSGGNLLLRMTQTV